MKSKGGLLINKINFLSGRVFNKILRNNDQLDLNHAQARILFIIKQHDNQISIQDLGTELSVSKSTLTTMLDRLTTKGYLIKQTAPTDKRMTLLSTTKKAQAEIKIFEDTLKQMAKTFYQDFTLEEIKQFETLLERVYHNLEKIDQS